MKTMTSHHPRPWRATHVITWSRPGRAPEIDRVMLDDGVAYTRAEWRAYASAYWELVDGRWTAGGQATPGGAPGTVEIVAVPPAAVEA